MNDPAPRKRMPVIGGLALLAVLLSGWYWLARRPAGDAAAAERATPTSVAVQMANVQTADVPLYLQGLGTVQAYYTVTVTPRVDGQLQTVAFTEGQDVSKGQLLAQIDPRPARAAYEQAVATRARDGAQLANARRDLARYRTLQPQDLTSKQTYETQQAQVEQQSAQLKIDQAAIDAARTQLDYTRIVSPISGRTGIRLIDPGNNVHASDTGGIVVVTQMQPISVIFTLPEDALPQLQAAMEAGSVTVVALSRDGGTPLDDGTVALIDNQIDAASGTIRVKGVFGNRQRHLWPGQFVSARVLLRVQHNALTVPASAVEIGPDGPYVYVVQPDSTVAVRLVKLAEQTDTIGVIGSGLKAGERVVTSNQYRLQPGAHVRAAGASADTAATGTPEGSATTAASTAIGAHGTAAT